MESEVEEPGWKSGNGEADSQGPVFSDHLSSDQRQDLQEVLEEFSDVLCNKPGRTSLMWTCPLKSNRGLEFRKTTSTYFTIATLLKQKNTEVKG